MLKIVIILGVCFCFCHNSHASSLPFEILDQEGNDVSVVVIKNKVYLKDYRSDNLPQIVIKTNPKHCQIDAKPCVKRNLQLKATAGTFPTPANTSHKLSIRLNGQLKFYFISIVDPDFPWFNIRGKSKLDRPFIFSVNKYSDAYKCYILILSKELELVFAKHLTETCTDFRPHQNSAGNFYSFLNITRTNRALGVYGTRTVLDEELREIDKISMELDGHEFLYLGPSHWIALEFLISRTDEGVSYINTRVRERHNGEVKFDWGVSDFLKKKRSQFSPMGALADYRGEILFSPLHLNSLQLLPNNRLLVGLGTNGVVLLDKSNASIEWTLGGIFDDYKVPFAFQPVFFHSPTFSNETNSVLLYSNQGSSDITSTRTVRVLEYFIDSGSHQLKDTVVHFQQETGINYAGFVQRIGKTLSISTGIFGQDREKVTIDDYYEQHEGHKNLSLRFKDSSHFTYRIYREPFGEMISGK